MDGERIVFTEESNPQNYLKLIASGDVDETMLEALEDYVKRQKRRLSTSRFEKGPLSKSKGTTEISRGWKGASTHPPKRTYCELGTNGVRCCTSHRLANFSQVLPSRLSR